MVRPHVSAPERLRFTRTDIVRVRTGFRFETENPIPRIDFERATEGFRTASITI